MADSSPAVFLDRDGTIMRDVDYCGDPTNVHVFEDVPMTLRKLQSDGYKLFIITNQSGIARGYFTEDQYRAVEREVSRQVGNDLIAATYFCPHGPNGECACRKPSPEMILRAAREHNLDLAQSWFVGDKKSDLQCGRNAGVKTVLVRTGYGREVDESLADLVADDLLQAADLILSSKND